MTRGKRGRRGREGEREMLKEARARKRERERDEESERERERGEVAELYQMKPLCWCRGGEASGARAWWEAGGGPPGPLGTSAQGAGGVRSVEKYE